MKIQQIDVSIAEPRPEIVALLAAIAAGVPVLPSTEGAAPSADVSTPRPKPGPQVLRIGEAWPGLEGSTYAGIARGRDGEADAHLVLLADKPEKALKWTDAVAWAEGLGDNARLPTRFESALLYANVQDQFDADYWHWTGSQYSAGYAWYQLFYYGYQDNYNKSYEGRCRAVRRFPL